MKPPDQTPVITLTTDFGLRDHYVGTMKGVILGRCPDARIVDISHEVPPFSIWAGAYTIDQAAPYFPPSTIHVVVIDPGVGTVRKPILVHALGQHFIAPDNGVLSLILRRESNPTVVQEISNAELFLPGISSTFHGRDVFAPVAAALAGGVATAEQVGPVLNRMEVLDALEPVQVEPGQWTGTVLSVDRFGNVVTNFKLADVPFVELGAFGIGTKKHSVNSFRRTFGGAPPDLCFVYLGSSGYIEMGMNQGSAARHLELSPGDAVYARKA